jgi:hypothetical protein
MKASVHWRPQISESHMEPSMEMTTSCHDIMCVSSTVAYPGSHEKPPCRDLDARLPLSSCSLPSHNLCSNATPVSHTHQSFLKSTVYEITVMDAMRASGWWWVHAAPSRYVWSRPSCRGNLVRRLLQHQTCDAKTDAVVRLCSNKEFYIESAKALCFQVVLFEVKRSGLTF